MEWKFETNDLELFIGRSESVSFYKIINVLIIEYVILKITRY
jgi:hypothetical protein